MKRVLIFAVLAMMLTGCGAFKSDHSTDTPPNYTVRELANPAEGRSGIPMDINEQGIVVGWYSVDLFPAHASYSRPLADRDHPAPPSWHPQACMWDNNGEATDIEGRSISGINNRGEMVGGDVQAILWHNGDRTNLGSLPGCSGGNAVAINELGHVAGDSYIYDGMGEGREPHAFIWRDGEMTGLGSLGEGSSTAQDINNRDQVVGYSYAVGGNHAFLWENGRMTDLGTLAGEQSSRAYAINDLGHIVGESGVAFLWISGEMIELELLPGKRYAVAYDINNLEQIVGSAHQMWSDMHAVLWHAMAPHDLNDLIPADSGWVLKDARAINNSGQIVGTGTYNGQDAAFILTPVE